MSDELSVDDLVKPQPEDQMTNHAEQHSLITDLIVAKDKLQQEIEARVEAGETIQQQILDSIDNVGGVHVGDDEPENPEEGDLWYDTNRLEMFIRYDGGWITTTALGARVAEGEAKQREMDSRLTQAVNDIAALRGDLEDRITIALWKFKGYNLDPTTLGGGDFTIHNEGLEGTKPLRIWMSVYDPSGNYWKTSTKVSANYASSFQVSIDKPGQNGQYNGLIKAVRLNQNPADHGDYETGSVHLIELAYVYSRRSMNEGDYYNISVPGYLPVYIQYKRLKSRVFSVDADIVDASSAAMQVNSEEEIQGASDTEMESGN